MLLIYVKLKYEARLIFLSQITHISYWTSLIPLLKLHMARFVHVLRLVHALQSADKYCGVLVGRALWQGNVLR